MGIFVKVLFVTIIAITIIVFAWKEITTILPVKVVSYVKIAGVLLSVILGVLLSVILGTLLFLL